MRFSASSLFCDDIRAEAGSKTSYMGVYGSEMSLHAAFPATLPTFAVVVSILLEAPLTDDDKISVIVTLPGEDKAAGRLEVTTRPNPAGNSPANSDAARGLRVGMRMSPLRLRHEGDIAVDVELNGERQSAGRLRVVSKPKAQRNGQFTIAELR